MYGGTFNVHQKDTLEKIHTYGEKNGNIWGHDTQKLLINLTQASILSLMCERVRIYNIFKTIGLKLTNVSF